MAGTSSGLCWTTFSFAGRVQSFPDSVEWIVLLSRAEVWSAEEAIKVRSSFLLS